MLKTKKRVKTLASRRAFSGLMFSLPILIGFVLFIFFPIVQSIVYSFSSIQASNNGMQIQFIGFKNYNYAFFSDPDFLKSIVSNLANMLVSFPLILMYSFFIATILNEKFRGRTIARAIFFLPVIITSGVIVLLQSDSIMGSAINLIKGNGASMQDTLQLSKVIMDSIDIVKISPSFANIIFGAVDKIYEITTASGVQILIFLAGLQTISPSLYEASSIEGATAWEDFWKITFPMISPLILVNSVYTIIDTLGGLSNPVVKNLFEVAFKKFDFGYSAAMGWVYFIFIFVILGIVIKLISTKVFYEND